LATRTIGKPGTTITTFLRHLANSLPRYKAIVTNNKEFYSHGTWGLEIAQRCQVSNSQKKVKVLHNFDYFMSLYSTLITSG